MSIARKTALCLQKDILDAMAQGDLILESLVLVVIGRGWKVQMFPIFKFLRHRSHAIPYTLNGIASEQKAQRRVGTVCELPNELGTLHSACRLTIAEPLHHPLCMESRRCGVGITLARGLDEEMTPGGQRVVSCISFVAPDKAWFNQRSLDIERVCFVEHPFDQSLDGIFCGTVRA